jgi:hypothetical protein
MALFRTINMNFWTDTKIADDYTPEDKYFMLYALTNNYTNLIGCYEISIKQIANDLGYNKDTVDNLIKRFKTIHKTIDYDYETKELLIKNWYKYNWNASPKLDIPLKENLLKIKSNEFYNYLAKIYNSRESVEEEKDTLSIGYRYPTDTTITITNTNTNNINNNINKYINNNIIEKEFEEIWQEYPRKQGKANALKSYIKVRKKGTDKEIIINGLKKYLEYIKIEKIETKYIKQGSTWFNQECWNDDYTIKKEITTSDLATYMDFSDFR